VLTAGKHKTSDDPATLDLLARIHAQQGRLAEAERLWTRALLLEPGNSAYVLALRRTSSLPHGSRRIIVMFPLVACIILGAFIGLAKWQRWWAGATPGAQARPGLSSGPLPTSSQPSPATSQGLESAAAQPPVEKSVNVRGVTAIRGPNGLTLSFDDGLFQHGVSLRPGAREKLRELGRQLQWYADNSAIQIIGMTDESPMPRRARYRDNVSLGMARARFVYDYLRLTGGLNSQTLVIGSVGTDGETHDPSDGVINRARRRTVVLHVGVAKKS
jgi:type VI secretion system protein ImpK